MNYDLELNKAITTIKENNAKLVCIQLPDGLKPQAQTITQTLHKQTNAEILIWAGSNFGACDVPHEVEQLGVDLLIAWGHTAWKK